MATPTLSAAAIPGIPVIEPGCDLAATIVEAIEDGGVELRDGDVFAIAQKIVSKAEGRFVELDSVDPGAEARELARKTDKDPRVVELILQESRRVVRHRPGAIITEHRLGISLANAGIDRSNVDQLEVAWTFHTGDAGADDRTQIQCNPIIVGGVLYASSPQLKIFALETGSRLEMSETSNSRAKKLSSRTSS